MWDLTIIVLVSFLGSSLTLFSGFGLGTLLLPVFSLFFPLEIAVAMTATVHLLNNFLKLSLFIKHTAWSTVLKFGTMSVIGAMLGAWLLSKLALNSHIVHLTDTMTTTPIKIVIGILMLVFAAYELWPGNGVEIKQQYNVIGGLVSGFFGGLSGHQGALRSIFLIHNNFSKEAYIATGVTIACLVDLTRLPIYFLNHTHSFSESYYIPVLASVLAAFLGVFVGNKLLKKITVKTIQLIVGTLLLLYGIFLIFGII